MNLKEYYESITLETLDQFVQEGKEENLQLDFKIVNRSDLSHKDDKKNFAKALSGYANSSGGIIVWGIEASKNNEGVDCAQAKSPIENIPLFISKLNEFTGIAVNPIVEGVLHKAIFEDDKKGFAISLIPESISCPHMAKFSEDRYYKRSGDSFYKMEHFDIEDMFGRRKKPSLELIYELNQVRQMSRERGLVITISLLNSGRGTAKAPYLEVKTPQKCCWAEYGYDGNGSTGLDRLVYFPKAPLVKFGSDSTKVIHPGISIPISKLMYDFNQDNFREDIKNIQIEYKTASEDSRIIENTLEIKEGILFIHLVNNGFK